jgi:hypothetical protein
MAYDKDLHEVNPNTGFLVHKDTGHMIGIEEAPVRVAEPNQEWPQWVTPHESHVVRRVDPNDKDADPTKAPVTVVQGFRDWHVNRNDGSVSVLVDNEDDAKRAAGERTDNANKDDALLVDNDIRRQVHTDFEAGRNLKAAEEAKKLAAEQDAEEEEEALRRTKARREREDAEKKAIAGSNVNGPASQDPRERSVYDPSKGTSSSGIPNRGASDSDDRYLGQGQARQDRDVNQPNRADDKPNPQAPVSQGRVDYDPDGRYPRQGQSVDQFNRDGYQPNQTVNQPSQQNPKMMQRSSEDPVGPDDSLDANHIRQDRDGNQPKR